jgi:hypothetical protein
MVESYFHDLDINYVISGSGLHSKSNEAKLSDFSTGIHTSGLLSHLLCLAF